MSRSQIRAQSVRRDTNITVGNTGFGNYEGEDTAIGNERKDLRPLPKKQSVSFLKPIRDGATRDDTQDLKPLPKKQSTSSCDGASKGRPLSKKNSTFLIRGNVDGDGSGSNRSSSTMGFGNVESTGRDTNVVTAGFGFDDIEDDTSNDFSESMTLKPSQSVRRISDATVGFGFDDESADEEIDM